jgi:hypothetical protein
MWFMITKPEHCTSGLYIIFAVIYTRAKCTVCMQSRQSHNDTSPPFWIIVRPAGPPQIKVAADNTIVVHPTILSLHIKPLDKYNHLCHHLKHIHSQGTFTMTHLLDVAEAERLIALMRGALVNIEESKGQFVTKSTCELRFSYPRTYSH